jgi:hypothetical protein
VGWLLHRFGLRRRRLLLDFASPDDAYETLSRGSWVIVAVSMAIGFTGVILDRSDELPKL